ncbi:hypothetical protein HKX48_007289 [Thoreauomyces humboldtii]|nr:hypothetical protein HKX48_007289 [Thoreauomyces humboldtii]
MDAPAQLKWSNDEDRHHDVDPNVTAIDLSPPSPDLAPRSRRSSIVDAARRVSLQGSVIAQMGMTGETPEKDEAEERTMSFGWLLAPDVLSFLVANTLLGAVFSVVASFLWIFLTDDLDAGATVRGMTGTMQVVLQLPFFFFAKQVLSRVGIRKSIAIAHVATIVRFAAYPFLKPSSVNFALGIELLHAYSMNWTASVSFAAAAAPRGMEFLAQGILGAFYGGLGSGLGGIIGGFVYSAYGSRTLWIGCAGVTALSLALYLAVPMREAPREKDFGDKNAKLLEEGTGGDVEKERDGSRRPSAVAMAVSNLGRRHSMISG